MRNLLRALSLSFLLSAPAFADRGTDDLLRLGARVELATGVAPEEAIRLAEIGGNQVLVDCSRLSVTQCGQAAIRRARLRVPGGYSVNGILALAHDAGADHVTVKAEEFDVYTLASLQKAGLRIERYVDNGSRGSDVEAALRRGEGLRIGPGIRDESICQWQQMATAGVEVFCQGRSYASCASAASAGASVVVPTSYGWQAVTERLAGRQGGARVLVNASDYDWGDLQSLAQAKAEFFIAH